MQISEKAPTAQPLLLLPPPSPPVFPDPNRRVYYGLDRAQTFTLSNKGDTFDLAWKMEDGTISKQIHAWRQGRKHRCTLVQETLKRAPCVENVQAELFLSNNLRLEPHEGKTTYLSGDGFIQERVWYMWNFGLDEQETTVLSFISRGSLPVTVELNRIMVIVEVM